MVQVKHVCKTKTSKTTLEERSYVGREPDAERSCCGRGRDKPPVAAPARKRALARPGRACRRPGARRGGLLRPVLVDARGATWSRPMTPTSAPRTRPCRPRSPATSPTCRGGQRAGQGRRCHRAHRRWRLPAGGANRPRSDWPCSRPPSIGSARQTAAQRPRSIRPRRSWPPPRPARRAPSSS